MANIKFFKKATRPTGAGVGSVWFDSKRKAIVLTGATAAEDVIYSGCITNAVVKGEKLILTKTDGNNIEVDFAVFATDAALNAALTPINTSLESIKGSFVPVQINDNKSGTTDATQLANIKAYASKLASSGVDISKGYEIPILYNNGSKGFIGYNPHASSYYNGYAVTPEGALYTLTMDATNGAVSKSRLATTEVTDLLSANKQPKTDNSLNTASKTVCCLCSLE